MKMSIDTANLIVLALTFFAVVWYTVETRLLRQWQKKSVQVDILRANLEIRTALESQGTKINAKYINKLHTIYTKGTMTMKDLYAPHVIKN